MAYETKVLLIAMAELLIKADSIEDAYESLARMANAEGIILKPLEEVRRARTG